MENPSLPLNSSKLQCKRWDYGSELSCKTGHMSIDDLLRMNLELVFLKLHLHG